MKLIELAEKLELKQVVAPGMPEAIIAGGYVSDLLSHVMGNACSESLWVTVQGHPNVVAVAVLVDIPAIVLTNGVQPEQATIAKAEEHQVGLYTTEKNSFTVVGELFQLGICGTDKWMA